MSVKRLESFAKSVRATTKRIWYQNLGDEFEAQCCAHGPEFRARHQDVIDCHGVWSAYHKRILAVLEKSQTR